MFQELKNCNRVRKFSCKNRQRINEEENAAEYIHRVTGIVSREGWVHKVCALSSSPLSINDIKKDIFSYNVLLNDYFYRNFIKLGTDYSKMFSQISAISVTFFLSS